MTTSSARLSKPERGTKVVAARAVPLLFMTVLLVSGCALRPASDRAVPAEPVVSVQVDAEELRQFPVATNLPGQPPASGLRYWRAPLKRLPCTGCYVTVIQRPATNGLTYEIWQNVWGEPDATARGMVVRRGPSLDRLGPSETVFDGRIISDVPDPKKPAELSALRGFTRPAMFYAPDIGYVLFACVCPDYLPGSVPLLPALVTSPTGRPGDWTYHGKLTGELAEIAAKGNIWSDGGSLLRLADGRWRIYLNGYGQVMTALESADLAGPWEFLRDERGQIRELLPDFPKSPRGGGCFPTILRVSPAEWHAWITDTWPPQCIWHFRSSDGLAWKPYGKQPEITRAAVGNRAIKCLRAYVDPDGKTIVGLLSVWDKRTEGERGWMLHEIRMPVGAPDPAAR